ncbi:hypothetical protein FNH06_28660 [Amycolatopsis acidiphila]|uniref:Uncharacterized protein n=1 Tax=Amycolatopsis acidiphila TaxID=715473 RepID=A0A558A1M8_9PSEU|nr:hypothetical protein FNH06_28660 [Amycolatopsis acidiphila]
MRATAARPNPVRGSTAAAPCEPPARRSAPTGRATATAAAGRRRTAGGAAARAAGPASAARPGR